MDKDAIIGLEYISAYYCHILM